MRLFPRLGHTGNHPNQLSSHFLERPIKNTHGSAQAFPYSMTTPLSVAMKTAQLYSPHRAPFGNLSPTGTKLGVVTYHRYLLCGDLR
jgi:hypothetical protein